MFWQSHELQKFVAERTEAERPSHYRILNALGQFPHCLSDLTLASKAGRNARPLNRRLQVFFNQSVCMQHLNRKQIVVLRP
jgi:hypothetical protein